MILSCKTCNKEFAVANYRKDTASYCSRSCHSKSKVGSKAAHWLGGPRKCSDCMNSVVKANAIRCRACSDKYRSGSNNAAWKGGVTPWIRALRASTQYGKWREQVFRRDDYTCQSCGQRGGKLNADHELPFSQFPDLRFELLNGRTLCESCHKKTPTYGRLVARFNLQTV